MNDTNEQGIKPIVLSPLESSSSTNVPLFHRYKKIFLLFGFLVLSFIAFEVIYFIGQENKKKQNNEAGNVTITTFPTKPISDNFTFTDIHSEAWQKARWQSYEFWYPKDFKLTDGSFSDTYFYLDVSGDSSKMIRIYGISENWNIATVASVVEERNTTDKQGFPGFHLEEQKSLPSETYARLYTWNLVNTTNYRTYELIKKFGRDMRFLRITASVSDWEANKSIFHEILNKIAY